MLELVLQRCGSRELGALNCAAKYFGATGITQRVARKRVDAHPRTDGVETAANENYARLLHFADSADVALRTSACISLGAFHTGVLGVAGAVPGISPALGLPPVRRRTDARDFASRRGLDDDAMYRWGDVSGAGDGDEDMFPVPSEDDERDEHGMSVFAPISEGFGAGSGQPPALHPVYNHDEMSRREEMWRAARAAREAQRRAGGAGSSGGDGGMMITPAAAAEARQRATSDQPRGRTLYTFGRGFHGQLGQGGYDDSAAPAAVTLAETGFADPSAVETISCGASHCAALDPDGVLLTWGLASSGELGHGGWTPIEVDVPRQVASMAAVKVKQVAAGANHTVVVSQGGGLWTCGRGRNGQLGHGHFHDAGPFQRLEALRGMSVLYAVAGGSHSLCLTDCGSVWSWGACRYGQLGLGDITFATAAGWESGVPWPCLVETLNDLDEPIVTMAAGGHHTLFVTAGGQLWATGRGEHGALGVGVRGTHKQYYYYEEDQREKVSGPQDHLVPRLVPVHHKPAPAAPPSRGKKAREGSQPDLKSVLARQAGRSKAAAEREARGAQTRRQSMRASCGGPGAVAEKKKERSRWIKAPCSCGPMCRVTHAAAGGNHSAVLTACGAVMTTGSNAYGQLGQGDTRKRYAFTRVESLRGERLATVATGEDHTGAVGEAGQLYLWGRGDWGQLGTGDGRSHWQPQVVSGVSVAPPAEPESYLGFKTVSEERKEDKADDDGEMGGPNQHLVGVEDVAGVY